ncbi:MAG: Rieske 2Fe-2S domain-containing protein, partial [Ketobacteraceae bacterium]|nr:Rieske 2Fe-2S domain-containing protein [Ketobacteraceae bacterium]
MTTFSEPQEVAQSRESNTRVTEEFDFIKAGIDMDRLRHEPKSWYYAGNIRSFTERPKPISPWGKPLVAYRSKGNIVIQYRHCVHMNTDLVKGKVVNGQLVCPMHAWKFNSDGECTDIPGGDLKQCRLTLPSFHTHQIGSHVFVYRQAKSACPVPPAFPEFSDLTWDEFELDPAIEFFSDTPWYLVTANGFDLCHFEFVHG